MQFELGLGPPSGAVQLISETFLAENSIHAIYQ